jgi:hypothetical protein
MTVARRMCDQLARLPGHLAIDQDVGTDLVVIIPTVAGRKAIMGALLAHQGSGQC